MSEAHATVPRVTVLPATRNHFTTAPITMVRKSRVAACALVPADSDEQLTSYEAQAKRAAASRKTGGGGRGSALRRQGFHCAAPAFRRSSCICRPAPRARRTLPFGKSASRLCHPSEPLPRRVGTVSDQRAKHRFLIFRNLPPFGISLFVLSIFISILKTAPPRAPRAYQSRSASVHSRHSLSP